MKGYPVIKKQDKDRVIHEADTELRDYESVPVKQNVQEYFEREVWQLYRTDG